jgi:hypothetical protein
MAKPALFLEGVGLTVGSGDLAVVFVTGGDARITVAGQRRDLTELR